MAQTKPPTIFAPAADRTRAERKVLAIELLRELAISLATLADSMERSPLSSGDWLTFELQGAQAASARWQRIVADYLHRWEVEDFELRREPPPDI